MNVNVLCNSFKEFKKTEQQSLCQKFGEMMINPLSKNKTKMMKFDEKKSIFEHKNWAGFEKDEKFV